MKAQGRKTCTSGGIKYAKKLGRRVPRIKIKGLVE